MAIHKIIFLIVFCCAALMSSLFIYHHKQTHSTPLISTDTGTVFVSPRDVKAFKLQATNGTYFTNRDFYHHWTLVFFGFTHCARICPTTLEVMRRVYPDLHAEFPNLRILLVSVDPERDTLPALQQYMNKWNTDFLGLTGKIAEIHKLQSQLGVYSARDPQANSTQNYQVQHTASLMLINPRGKWAGVLRFGLSPEELKKAVKIIIQHG